jgi:two-component system, chemotaxis family, CheB/CheR fusion protein
MANGPSNNSEEKFPVSRQRDVGAADCDGHNSFPIVGIGASAGGLEAYQQLLANLPNNTDMAYVLVQHLDPHHQSRLADLLMRHSPMPIIEAMHGMAVRPNHIYVIPPNANLAITHGVLQVSPREGRLRHLPIDYFFRTLAEDQKTRAVGVILSGTGSDGAHGLCEIKAVGGITFAQDADSAKYPGMPQSAAESGCADLILPPEQIAQRLAQIRTHPYLIPSKPSEILEAKNADVFYRKILARVRGVTGVDFTLYRDTTIKRRIMRRMALYTQDSLAQYSHRLDSDPEEVKALYHDLLINVTSFFRDASLFEALKENVYPAIMQAKPLMTPLRVWVPGCSTGQEAYSIAMSLVEFFDDKPSRPPLQIFATDICDSTILDKARAGIYPDSIEAEVSPERLRRFFQKEDHIYRVEKPIRDMCIFARQNLAADPPFLHVDLVSCRNVLIYLSTLLQKRVLPTFHYALNQPGFLLLGGSETIGELGDLFQFMEHTHRIYERKPAESRPFIHLFDMTIGGGNAWNSDGGARPTAPPADFQREADRLLLGRFAPPGVLINENLDIIQFRGRTSAYLEVPPGEPTTNVLKMAREGLFSELRNAIAQAGKNQQTARREGLYMRSNVDLRRINIEVIPVKPAGVQENHYLILFEDELPAESESIAPSPVLPPVEEERELEQLRRELSATKEYLQSLIEQQDAANEELRSANEEILSSNEELQSTNEELTTAKEELQSTNEELTTVNEQLQNRNVELNHLNDDLTNLLSSTGIPVVMVGPDLRIRRFTQAARRAMNLLANDIGRPIGDLKTHIAMADLEALILEVIDRVEVREREVRDREGRWHTLRIHPYRTADRKIEGAVILLIDVDEIKKSVDALRETEARFRLVADSAPVPIWVNGPEGCEFVNKAYVEFVGAGSDTELRGQQWTRYVHPDDSDTYLKAYSAAVEQRARFEAIFRFRRADGTYRWLKSVGLPRFSGRGDFLGYVGSSFDITDVREAVDELKEADRQKNEFLALLAHELRNPLAPISNALEILRAFGDHDSKLQTSRDIISHELQHMSRMLEDLLDLSRLTRDRLTLRKTTLKLADAFDDAVTTSRPFFEAKKHQLKTQLPNEDLWLEADRVRLCQIISNLLINAAKYSGEGGQIELAARVEESGETKDSPSPFPSPPEGGEGKNISAISYDRTPVLPSPIPMGEGRVRAESDQSKIQNRKSKIEVAISIKDNGIGMTKELLGRIFEMFTQGEPGGSEGGLGIGLTLVKSLVRLHGGSIEARSEGPNQGSEFVVRLPVIAAPQQTLVPEAKLVREYRPHSILVVDDNEMQLTTLRILLESYGHQVRTATRGESAVAQLEQFIPDIALIDLGLPRGMSGYDLARYMRGDPRFAHTVLIAQTGWGRDQDRAESRAAGFDHHLVKPLDHEQLQSLITAVPT